MLSPLQIEFHNAPPTEQVSSRIRQELAELEKFYNRLVSCRVDVEAPQHDRRAGLSKVRVDFGLPAEDAARQAELLGARGKERADHIEVKAHRRDPAMAVHAAFNMAHQRIVDLLRASHKGE